MRPKERRESGQNDLFRARLDQIVDVGHPLVKLGKAIAWRFLEDRFAAAYSDRAGHPTLPTRLMAGLAILKSMHDLSDEDLCARWIEGVVKVTGFTDALDDTPARKRRPTRQVRATPPMQSSVSACKPAG